MLTLNQFRSNVEALLDSIPIRFSQIASSDSGLGSLIRGGLAALVQLVRLRSPSSDDLCC